MTSPKLAHQAPHFRTREGGLLYQYYQTLQRETGELVPRRRALNPMTAKAILPYLVVIEVVDPEKLIMRLAGTVVVNRMGVNPVGTNIFDRMKPNEKEEAWLYYRRLLDTPCGGWLRHQEPYENTFVDTEIVMFPLTDQDGKPRFTVSISAELNLQDLAARGAVTKDLGSITEVAYLDIGAGV